MTILIPSRNASNLLSCVYSIRKNKEYCRIVVIDDGLEAHPPHCTIVNGVKPFIFSRSINQGIREAEGDDILILNDDAMLQTERGFTLLEAFARRNAITSAAIRGVVGNPHQQEGSEEYSTPEVLCFIAVFIPREVYTAVGDLDERFVNYGWEDNDYCRRARMLGFDLSIFHGCVVEHASHPSTFRTQPMIDNAAIYREKWSL